jgi:hypothetical protein
MAFAKEKHIAYSSLLAKQFIGERNESEEADLLSSLQSAAATLLMQQGQISLILGDISANYPEYRPVFQQFRDEFVAAWDKVGDILLDRDLTSIHRVYAAYREYLRNETQEAWDGLYAIVEEEKGK